MKKLIASILAFTLAFAPMAEATTEPLATFINGATSVGSFNGTEEFPVTRNGTTTLQGTAAQLQTYASATPNVTGATGVLPVINGGTANNFPNWYPALAQVIAGTGNARICVIDDSTGFGVYSNGTGGGDLPPLSYPSQLANLLNQEYGISAHQDAFMGDQGIDQTLANDARVGISGFTQDTNQTLGGMFLVSSTTGNQVTFTPTNPVDTFRVFYQTNSGNGSLSSQIDSGTTTNYATGTGTAGLTAVTVTAGSVGTHTIHVRNVSGTVRLAGIEAYNSTVPSVSIINMGWSGSTTSNWNISTNPWNAANVAAYQTLACNLTIEGLGINNWLTSISPSTTYSDLLAITTAAKAGGTSDVVMKTPVPTNTGSATQATQLALVAQMYNVWSANSLNGKVIDIFNRWGSFTNAELRSLYGDGFTHPLAVGYLDEAEAILSQIVPVSQFHNKLGSSEDSLSVYLGLPSTATVAQSTATFASNSPLTDYIALTNTSNSHSAQIFEGGTNSTYANYFGVYDATATADLFTVNDSTFAFSLTSGGIYGWNSNAATALSAPDTGISRISAGVIGIGTGAQGSITGTVSAASYKAAGTAGVTCTGTPTSSFATVGGIVTHC